MPRNFQDLTGQTFGRLTVTGRAPRRNGKTCWECRCSCGGAKTVIAQNLKDGATSSCGCWLVAAPLVYRRDRSGERYGRLTALRVDPSAPRTTWVCLCDCGAEVRLAPRDLRGRSVCSRQCPLNPRRSGHPSGPLLIPRWASYRADAKRYGRTFALTEVQFRALTGGNCVYCRAVPVGRGEGPACNGLDRVDNARGYEWGNVVPACFRCNRAKWSSGLEEFLRWRASMGARPVSMADFAQWGVTPQVVSELVGE